LDDAESKAALIWIIGEYAERIDNAPELIEYFLENFKLESSMVQLQLLTSSVKLFLKKPGSAQEIVQKVLSLATQGNDNPDIRDRAYVYWRLLSASPQMAKSVVLVEKPPIEMDLKAVNDSVLNELIANIASLASVYYKPVSQVGQEVEIDYVERYIFSCLFTMFSVEYEEGEGESQQSAVQVAAQALGSNVVGDLLDLDFGGSSSSAPPNSATVDTDGKRPTIDDLLGDLDMPSKLSSLPVAGSPAGSILPSEPITPLMLPKSILLDQTQARGLELQVILFKNLLKS
jgi:hypothetical protein